MTEVAKRVPVYLGARAVGTGYVVEDETFIIVKNKEFTDGFLAAVTPNNAKAFMLGVWYTPEKEVADVSPGAEKK